MSNISVEVGETLLRKDQVLVSVFILYTFAIDLYALNAGLRFGQTAFALLLPQAGLTYIVVFDLCMFYNSGLVVFGVVLLLV